MKYLAIQVIFPHFKDGLKSRRFECSEKNPVFILSKKLPAEDWVKQAWYAPENFAKSLTDHADRVPELKGASFKIESVGENAILISVAYKQPKRPAGIGKTSHF